MEGMTALWTYFDEVLSESSSCCGYQDSPLQLVDLLTPLDSPLHAISLSSSPFPIVDCLRITDSERANGLSLISPLTIVSSGFLTQISCKSKLPDVSITFDKKRV